MLTPNTVVNDRYMVESQLGGSVYQALDLTTRAHVALKPLGAGSPAAAERVSALLALRHPNLPVARELIEESGQPLLVLELVPGDDLTTLVQRHGRAPIELARRWAWQLFDALDYIHTLAPPLVHGTIEPASVRLDARGDPILLGFGLPRPAPADPTPFAPPEHPAGPPGDVYALAATLYYALVGQAPVAAGERASALAQGRPDPLVAPRALDTRVPAALSNAIRQALALEPAARPSAAAMLAAIDDLPTRLPPPAPRPARWRWALGAAGVLLALLAVAFPFMRSGTAAQSGAATSAAVQTTSEPSPAPTSQPAPTNLPAPTLIATTKPTALPSISVAGLQPATLLTRTQPLTLTLQGAHLELVTAARLIAEGHPALAATIVQGSAGELTLQIEPPTTLANGEATYQVELNGAPANAPPVTLRDFVERATVQGVLEQYAYTERVAADSAGPYTRMRAEPSAASPPIGLLRNGDQVDVLELGGGGWYLVRIRTSADPAQIGVVGWVEQWLIDNQDVPAAPTPWKFVGRLASTPTDAAVRCGTAFESSIYGSVSDERGAGIRGARLRVVSADQRNSYTITTGRGGVYSVPGLGCTTWTVRLLSVPGAPNGIQANVVTVRNLNGGKYTAAEVRYRLAP